MVLYCVIVGFGAFLTLMLRYWVLGCFADFWGFGWWTWDFVGLGCGSFGFG